MSTEKSLLLAQQIMYQTLTDRQVRYVPQSDEEWKTFRHQHEYPLQVGVGLLPPSKWEVNQVIDVLHEFGVSVNYARILRIENQLAQAVLSNSSEDNISIPPRLCKGQFIFSVLTIPISQKAPPKERTHFMQPRWLCSSENVLRILKLYWKVMLLWGPSPFHKSQYLTQKYYSVISLRMRNQSAPATH